MQEINISEGFQGHLSIHSMGSVEGHREGPLEGSLNLLPLYNLCIYMYIYIAHIYIYTLYSPK